MDIHDINRVEAVIGDHIEAIMRKPSISNDECALLQNWLGRLDYHLMDPVETPAKENGFDSIWALIVMLLIFGWGRPAPAGDAKEAV